MNSNSKVFNVNGVSVAVTAEEALSRQFFGAYDCAENFETGWGNCNGCMERNIESEPCRFAFSFKPAGTYEKEYAKWLYWKELTGRASA